MDANNKTQTVKLYIICRAAQKSHSRKNEFSVKDFFSKCDQIRRELRIWSHLLKKCLMENNFCVVSILQNDRSYAGT